MQTIELNNPAQWKWRKSPVKALELDAEQLPEGLHDEGNETVPQWIPCHQMPSLIHSELLAVGMIPDPYKGSNDELVQWVGEEDWLYHTTFKTPDEPQTHSDLVFEGLDTFATVLLNDKKILESDNMFLPHRIDVTDKLKSAGETNTLTIVFASAFIKGRIIEEEHLGKDKHLPLWNGDPARLWVRKEGAQWGWDWGPTLMSAGPWKPVRLETYEARIVDLHPVAIVSEDLSATLHVEIDTSSKLARRITVLDPQGNVFKEALVKPEEETPTWKLSASEIELWWSVGLGKQPLYTVKAELLDSQGDKVLHTASKRFGFRRLRLVQEPLKDQPGTSFVFECNNIRLFAGGSNWIPIDCFITDADDDRYRRWLELLVEGNQNMIRVWGGGIYEHDIFYDTCDELGILVWQGFMFGCGAYPAHPEFVESVRKEAEANVLRIRSHPCMAIYAGANEDYQVAESLGLEYDPDDEDGDWSKTNFPAREIYERTLPEVVHRLTDVYYHRNSPYGGKDTRDPTVGDIHQWNVWHGTQEPYQHWDKLGGRFVSEFGMHGAPDIRTINDWIDDPSQRFPQSKAMISHNKADGGERRLMTYIVENIRFGPTLEDYVFASQFIQAETLSTAYRLFRRDFRGKGQEYNSGALVWQINDVFGCVSWSIVDYYLRPKPSFYTIKQSMTPVAVGMKRFTEKTPEGPHSALFTEKTFVEVWGCNSTLKSLKLTLVLEAFELLSGERVYVKETDVTLKDNRSTELIKIEEPCAKSEGAAVAVSAKLVDPETKEILSRFLVLPEPYKYLTFPDEKAVALSVKIDVTVGTISIKTARAVKGFVLAFDTDVKLSDNALDLIPGDERVVTVKGLTKGTKVSWRYLGDSFVP